MPQILAGTPTATVRGGSTKFSVTSAPAPTMLPSPMTAPFITVACMPISAPSPTVQPCTSAQWPTVTFRPMRTSWSVPVCTTAPSWMLVPSPTVMLPLSARSTAP